MCAITIRSSGKRRAISSSRIGRACSSEPARANVVPWWISMRQLEPLQRLADAEERGPERVDILVDRPELAADEAEVGLHALELVERGADDGSTAPKPTSRAGSRATYAAT